MWWIKKDKKYTELHRKVEDIASTLTFDDFYLCVCVGIRFGYMTDLIFNGKNDHLCRSIMQ